MGASALWYHGHGLRRQPVGRVRVCHRGKASFFIAVEESRRLEFRLNWECGRAGSGGM